MKPPTGGPVLRIVATSDLHAELRDFDYARVRPDPSKGLCRAAGVIARLRQEVTHSVLVDAGDFLHGRPYSGLPDRGVHAVMAAMSALEYDAVTLGNHEFDGGVDLLEAALAASDVPIVTGNILRRATGAGYHPPFRLLRRTVKVDGTARTLTVGLTGVLPPETLTGAERMAWDRLDVPPVADIAPGLLRRMRAEGADLIVALCHEGPKSARVMARSGVDAIAMGHLHKLFPGPKWPMLDGIDADAGTILGVPAVMPGAWGRAVGALDLSLAWSPKGWRVASSRTAVHRIATEPSSPRAALPVLKASRGVHAAALAESQRSVIELDAPLHTYFARLGRCRATRLTAAAAAQAVRRAVADGPLADLPVVGLAAPVLGGGLGGPANFVDIPRGTVTAGDLRGLVPHGDPIWGIEANAAYLTLWLERTVSALRQVIPGQIVPELSDLDFPSAAYDLPDCATFDLDLTRPAAFHADGTPTGHPPERVRNLRIGGRPVTSDMPLLLAVTEHRVRGGGGFPLPKGAALIETGARGDTALTRYLTDGLPIPPASAFTILPIPHAIASHRIGPGARAFPAEASALGLTRSGRAPGGWDIYRMDLFNTAPVDGEDGIEGTGDPLSASTAAMIDGAG